jgi:hypothetical protein
VRFEDRVHFLLRRNLLAIEHPPPSLVNDLLAQIAVGSDLLAKLLNHQSARHIDLLALGGLGHDLARVLEHLLGDAEQLAVLGLLLALPLRGGHPFQFLHAAPRAPGAVGETLHAARQFLMESVDQPGDRAHGVPQQSGIGGIVDVGLHHRSSYIIRMISRL